MEMEIEAMKNKLRFAGIELDDKQIESIARHDVSWYQITEFIRMNSLCLLRVYLSLSKEQGYKLLNYCKIILIKSEIFDKYLLY